MAATRYDANVSRDKAERRLPESERKLLDKIFTANAVSARVLKSHIWVDGRGNMRRFSVTLRQGLTNIDRADLTVSIAITSVGADHIAIDRPDPKATSVVASLGQLVTKVAGA